MATAVQEKELKITLNAMTTEEKFALLTPEGKTIVIQEIERLLNEQSKEQELG